MPKKNTFDILLPFAGPGAGKSEVIDYLGLSVAIWLLAGPR